MVSSPNMVIIVILPSKHSEIYYIADCGIPMENSLFAMTHGKNGCSILQDSQGYKFSLHSTHKSGRQRWQCSRKKTLKCTVCVKVDALGNMTQFGQHCHPPYISK